MKTTRNIKLKDGREFSKGMEFSVSFNQEVPSSCVVNFANGESYKTRTTRLPSITDEIYSPSVEEVDEWVNDGVCDSVLGEQVEPDGWDSEGSPSWLLAMGLI